LKASFQNDSVAYNIFITKRLSKEFYMSLIHRDTPRTIKFTKNINPYAHGSVMAEFGNTKVHITATVEEDIPRWMKGRVKGWVTAEYNMLPGSTHERIRRERSKVGGRTSRDTTINWKCSTSSR
jgi:ribonuclease PH